MKELQLERIKYIFAVVLYGTIGLFLRYVNLPSEVVAMFRGLIGSLFIYLYLRFKHVSIDKKAIRNNLFLLLLSGICLGLNWIFLFASYMTTTVAIASLCNYLAPLFVIIVSPLVLHEKLEIKKLPYVALAFLGIVLVSGVFDEQKGSLIGIVYGVLAALVFSIIIICNRKLKDISVYDRSIVQLLVSAITIFPYVLIHNHGVSLNPDLRSILIVIMLGVIHTGLAYCFYFSGMAKLDVETIAILGYLEPVVSVICSTVFLHEPMSVFGWLGALLIIFSAFMSEKR
ncbi:MAG: EamA family transporter [Erysipelotrichaceae bacterium]|nr:EamA family transporter [Erysipelotrichaceae bacterium]